MLGYNALTYTIHNDMRGIMRKPAFCICENKGADQLCGNRRADHQRLCFRYIDSAIPLLSKLEAIFLGCTTRFVSDMVGNPKYRFSHGAAQMICYLSIYMRSIINQVTQDIIKHEEDIIAYFVPIKYKCKHIRCLT